MWQVAAGVVAGALFSSVLSVPVGSRLYFYLLLATNVVLIARAIR